MGPERPRGWGEKGKPGRQLPRRSEQLQGKIVKVVGVRARVVWRAGHSCDFPPGRGGLGGLHPGRLASYRVES